MKNKKRSIQPPEGFYYIAQDNYYIANLDKVNEQKPEKYLYSDSATSCIIVIIQGYNRDCNQIAALSHLGKLASFHKFFDIVAENFYGPIAVYAQGGNPPWPEQADGENSYSSLINSQVLLNWLCSNCYTPLVEMVSEPQWYIRQTSLSLGQGHPLRYQRGCYGIDLTKMKVSNKRFDLSAEQRDFSGGVQTLFSIFGLDIEPQLILHKADEDFSPNQIKSLVEIAREYDWPEILEMSDEEILTRYSSTPEYEVPWFVEVMKQSALYVKNHN